jgi:uncharacterized protein (TIGR02646 family)
LWLEQKGLCAYCEQEIPKEDSLKSHPEHIRSQRDFKHLTFVFENIILSCEGFNLTLEEQKVEEKRQFCAHMKDRTIGGVRNYDDTLFLNPSEITDIETYFRYDSEGNIEPNPQKSVAEKARANYMIRVLELNHSVLIEMRRNQYDIWLEKQMTLTEAELTVELDENQPLLPAFFTMLKEKIL